MARRASEQDLVQPRRSPRTIEKLFGEIQMAELTKRQTRVLLSLAQCTGWSADYIRLKMKEVSGKTIKPEDIWSFHWQWMMDRGTQVVGPEEIDIMLALLKEEGVTLSKIGRALHTREQPISVPFNKTWKPKMQNCLPICKGFTVQVREQSKTYLRGKPLKQFAKFAPAEDTFTLQFGSTVRRLMKEALEDWTEGMRVRIEDKGPYKVLNDKKEYLMFIMEILGGYHNKYEEIFGEMESQEIFGKIKKDGTLHIKSTGFGVKVLLGLILAGRLQTIDQNRQDLRELTGFERVFAANLPEDSMNCCVCQDPLDIETPEGTMEEGLRLVICCQQVIGENCLKAWLAPSDHSTKKNCPNCRFDFPESFMFKLFGDGYLMEVDSETEDGDEGLEGMVVVEEQNEAGNRVSPSAEPEQDNNMEGYSPESSPVYDLEPAQPNRSPAPSPSPAPLLSPSPAPLPLPLQAPSPSPSTFPAPLPLLSPSHVHVDLGLPDLWARRPSTPPGEPRGVWPVREDGDFSLDPVEEMLVRSWRAMAGPRGLNGLPLDTSWLDE